MTDDIRSFLPKAFRLKAIVDCEFGEDAEIPSPRAADAVSTAARFVALMGELLGAPQPKTWFGLELILFSGDWATRAPRDQHAPHLLLALPQFSVDDPDSSQFQIAPLMDPLPNEPRTLPEFVEADLRRAARLIIKVQDEIDPQFRFSTPEGDYHLAVTLPADPFERRSMLRRVSAFMSWKQALGFTLASELIQPDCVYCLGVTLKEVCACLSRVRREPTPWTRDSFGPVEWIDRAQIGEEMIDLLRRGPRAMTPKETAMLHKWFGPDGRYPAVHLPTRALRGI